MMPKKYWNDHLWMRAQRLRANGLDFAQVAEVLGMTPSQVEQRFKREDLTHPSGHNAKAANVSDKQAAERDARAAAAERRTFTQQFFGDPPPGFSALDQRR